MKLVSSAFAQTEPAPPAPAPEQSAPAPATAQTPPAQTAPTPPTQTGTGVVHPGGGDQPAPPALPDLLAQIVPILIIMGIVYIIVIRPQQRQAREQKEQLKNVRRGDTIVTSGGLIGKVTKAVDDTEVEFEISPNVRVRLLRTAIAEVRARGEPVKDQASSAKT